MRPGSRSAPAVLALLVGLGLLLVLFALGAGGGLLLLIGVAVLAPGLWWRYRTREFRRGVKALRRGARDAAVEHFEKFLAQVEERGGFLRYQPFFNLGRPYDYVAAAHNNLGVIALAAGDREEARVRFDAALEQAPTFGKAAYGAGAVLLLEGDLSGAERAASRGLELDPGHPPCVMLLALCRAERDDTEGARDALTRLRNPVEWEDARSMWAEMYRFWGAPRRAARWEEG